MSDGEAREREIRERHAELEAEHERLKAGFFSEQQAAEAELAQALGYPYHEGYGWVVGEHTVVTLAMEARRELERLRELIASYRFTNGRPENVE